MRYVDEFRNRRLIDKVAQEIRCAVDPDRVYNIMEVCGTHTMSIFRFGLRDILPKSIKLISGPGCPVCVTPNEFIDKAIAIANMKGVIIATFGDMLKVPGSRSSLEKEKAKGCDIRIVYSSLDALQIARKNPNKRIVFLGIGFETTAPTVAQSILIAKKERLNNYSVLSGHKTMPEVMEALVHDKLIKVDAFLLPGHVSAIIGMHPYEFLSKSYKKSCVISGFEPIDILQSILMIIKQVKPKVEIQYGRIIEKSGNPLAKKSINKVFERCLSVWRGIGRVRKSGLKIRRSYKEFDADYRHCEPAKGGRSNLVDSKDNIRCFCGYILKGLKTPYDCPSFAKACTPENPIGACMVSSEGTCAANYKYGKDTTHSR
ncbi:MAG: hydrogenase formation protein HypD [Candidatus Omnitrophica bacterium]|nr:hydrogenase formation protein HypD [Candidatus Omnitrophota bacterium]